MLWIKTFHLFFVVAWFAGVFYLPRIFVNLAMKQQGETYQHLLIMARKLYRFTTPFMVLTLIFGGWLTSLNSEYYLQAGWFHTKMGIIFLLVAYQIYCGVLLKRFTENQNTRSHVFYRWFNEIPVLLLLGAIVLAVLKPF